MGARDGGGTEENGGARIDDVARVYARRRASVGRREAGEGGTAREGDGIEGVEKDDVERGRCVAVRARGITDAMRGGGSTRGFTEDDGDSATRVPGAVVREELRVTRRNREWEDVRVSVTDDFEDDGAWEERNETEWTVLSRVRRPRAERRTRETGDGGGGARGVLVLERRRADAESVRVAR